MYMELIYLYVEKFEDIIMNQEINFSPNFSVKIEDKKLIIKNKLSCTNKLYPSNITNINVLLGKNGCGKTTILDILGMNYEDRCRNSIKRKGVTRSQVFDSYFFLYHIEGDYYGIEVMDDVEPKDKILKLFNNKMINFDFGNREDIFYKIPMGFVFKKKNDRYEVVENFFREYKKDNKLVDLIRVNYISNIYSERIDIKHNTIGKDKDNFEDDPYLCKRRYYENPSKVMQYKFINQLNNDEGLHFIANAATIEIKPNFDYALNIGMNKEQEQEKEEMEEWIDELESILYIDKSETIHRAANGIYRDEKIKDKSHNKKIFILDTLSSIIINYFIEGVCKLIDDNNIQKIKLEGIPIDLTNREHIKLLNDLKLDQYTQCNTKKLLGTVVNKKNEYENLIKVITYYKEDETLEIYCKLIFISRYLYSRMESSIGLGEDSRYQIAIEEFLQAIYALKETYFNKDIISISCNLKYDELLVKALKIYDKYVYNQFNDIRNRFRIKFKNLSEGQMNFLDIFSKIFDVISKTDKDKLSIILLDEPDRSFHPEWSRRFFDFICREIQEYKNINIQLVVATHSPFIVSDLPKGNIVFLKNENGQCTINHGNEFKQTFGANVHTLLTKSFFMDNTIGEYANRKIKNVIEELSEETNNMTKEEIKFIISSIGEPIIKRKLEDMYSKRFEQTEINNQIQELSNRVKELEEIIKTKNLHKYKLYYKK